jgi:hypothetical protein
VSKKREINVFSLSFLDTFCNALGAMILLFILNSNALTRSMQSAVEKYRVKTVELEKERRYAEAARNDAQLSRNDAQLSRDAAFRARDEAEKSEQRAVQNRELAMISEREARAQKELAEQKAEEARLAEQRSLTALEELKVAQARMAQTNQELSRKNEELSKLNQRIEQAFKQNVSREKKFQEILDQKEQVQKEYQVLLDKQQNLSQTMDSLEQQKKQLQEECDRLTLWYKEAKEQANSLKGQYQNAAEDNKTLAQRLSQKETELSKREREIAAREEEIRKREEETASKNQKIAVMEQDLNKKDDRSLFGVKLSYQRILFLFDRSGSIVQNNWKETIIGTCKEILEHCEVEEFAIVAFSSDMRFCPPRRGLMWAGDNENKKKAVQWLQQNVEFGGTTHIHEAIRIAYEDYGRLDAIFLLTDGLPSVQNRTTQDVEKEIIRYIEKQVGDKVATKIISIAIGYPPADAEQYAAIYKYLHRISDLTGGQYLGR